MHRMIAAMAVCILAGVTSARPPRPDPAKFGWYTDYAAGKAEARRTGKPIFLVFRCEP